MEKNLFSGAALGSLTDEDRRTRLDQMERELAAFIGQCSSRQQFFHRTKQAVEMLRSIGHDLWSVDADGRTFAVWAADYARPDLVGRFVVTFTYPDRVRAEWSSDL